MPKIESANKFGTNCVAPRPVLPALPAQHAEPVDKKCDHQPILITLTSTVDDVKFDLLQQRLVPKDLISKLEKLKTLDENACIYIDNGGTPTYYPVAELLQVLSKVDWDNLAIPLQDKFGQLFSEVDRLSERLDNINFIGEVVSVNGKKGDVVLTAADVGALDANSQLDYNNLINKPNINSLIDFSINNTVVVVDGGLIVQKE